MFNLSLSCYVWPVPRNATHKRTGKQIRWISEPCTIIKHTKGHELHAFAAFLALHTLRLACVKLSLDLVDVDFLVVVAAAVSVFVELDVVVYTFVAVSISLRLACILQYRAAEKKRQHTYPSRWSSRSPAILHMLSNSWPHPHCT